MKLPERLETIISMVPKCDTAADIGCDHAYVSIALVERGIAKRAIACDINTGPLKHAEENIRTAGVEEKIETRLCDGLSGVKAGEADTVIIAGMGGMLMEKILDGRLKDFPNYVLSPQLDIPHFRHFLIDHGCTIEDEQMVEEDGKFYVVMQVKCNRRELLVKPNAHEKRPQTYDTELKQPYRRDIDFLFGGWLLQKKDPVLKSFLDKERARYQDILTKTDQTEIREKLSYVLKALFIMG